MKKFSLGQLGDYEIKQLKVFKTVVDCGGFSAAEAHLSISRPTISVHIANLESRLNLTLCKRGRGGFSLTEEGAVIYQQTCQLLEVLDGFRNTINNLSTSPSGRLRLALSDTFATDPRCKLDQIIDNFNEHAPDVELNISVEHMVDMERRVLNDELDLALIPYHRKLEGLNYHHLFTDRCFLYCGQKNPLFAIADAEISDELIHNTPLVHAGVKPHEEAFLQLSELNLSAISYHYEPRIAMLMSGRYLAFLPETIAQPYLERGEIRAVAKESKHYALGAAAISRKTAPPNRARVLMLQTIAQLHTGAPINAPY